MIDPSHALPSFQAALQAGLLKSQSKPGLIDPDLWLYVDPQTQPPRFVYYRAVGSILSVLVIFARAPDVEGLPCMQVGYAVPVTLQGRGIATGAVISALNELQNGFAGRPPLFIEAVVGVENVASQHVAKAAISQSPTSVTDELSGAPAYRYLLRLVPPPQRIR